MGTVIIVNALLQILFAMLISPATQRVSLHSFAFRTGWPIGALVLVVAITNALVERIVQKTRRVVLECYTQHREQSPTTQTINIMCIGKRR